MHCSGMFKLITSTLPIKLSSNRFGSHHVGFCLTQQLSLTLCALTQLAEPRVLCNIHGHTLRPMAQRISMLLQPLLRLPPRAC